MNRTFRSAARLSMFLLAGLRLPAAIVGPLNHPADVSGTTQYVNPSGAVVGTATWRVRTNSGNSGDLGQAIVTVTVTNNSAKCMMSAAGFSLYSAAPVGSNLLKGPDTIVITSTGFTVPPGGTISQSAQFTILLPSYIYGAGLDATDFLPLDPNRRNASLGSQTDRYVAITNSCFAQLPALPGNPTALPPKILSLSANPQIIDAGAESTLSWSLSTSSATVSLTPKADVTGNIYGGSGTGVMPARSTTYTLTISNQYGTDSRDITVFVRTSLVAAHLTFAGPWETSIVVVNPTSHQALGKVSIFDESGQPLVLPTLEKGAAATFPMILQPFSSTTITSTPADGGQAQLGWARLDDSSGGTLQGFVVFRLKGAVTSEATVPFAAPAFTSDAEGLTVPFDNTSGFITGLAVTNAAFAVTTNAGRALPITAITEDGLQFDLGVVHLEYQAHRSFVLTDQFPQLKGKRGLLRITQPSYPPASVYAAIGLRFTPSLTFTTLPTSPAPAPPPSQ